jgi:chromosome segregation ATPase
MCLLECTERMDELDNDCVQTERGSSSSSSIIIHNNTDHQDNPESSNSTLNPATTNTSTATTTIPSPSTCDGASVSSSSNHHLHYLHHHHQHHHHHEGQAVVSLLEKYSTLHRGIDEARQKQDDQMQAINDTEKAIEDIHIVRKEMEEQTIQTIQERYNLVQELEQTLSHLAQLQDEHSNVVSNRDLVRNNMESIVQRSKGYQMSFLKYCQDYRRTIHQLSIQVSEMDGLLPHMASLAAYSIVHPTKVGTNADPLIDELRSQSITKSMAPVVDSQREGKVVGDDNDSNKSNRLENNEESVHKNTVEDTEDDEMTEAWNRLEKLQNSRDMARKNLEIYQKEVSEIQQIQLKKDLQQHNLQSQLEKLDKMVQDLRSQLERVQQETDETNQMTLVFQTGKTKKILIPTPFQ